MKQGTKNILLVLGFISILILAYNYSFSTTFEVKEQLDDLNMQIAENSNSGLSQTDLEGKERFLDSIIKKNNSGNSLQNDLLEVLNKHSKEHDFKIVSFRQPHHYLNEDQTEITSFQFELEGKYENLEHILHILEKDHSFGSLSHISFEKKKDYKMNKEFLQCRILVQNVK